MISPRVDWKGAKELGGHTSQMETAASERTLYSNFGGPTSTLKANMTSVKNDEPTTSSPTQKVEVSWRESMPCLPCMQLVDMAAPFIHGAYQWGHHVPSDLLPVAIHTCQLHGDNGHTRLTWRMGGGWVELLQSNR